MEYKEDNKKGAKLYEVIIDEIKAIIVKNSMQPGDKLPSERELAEMFNVSRIPVREAIKILEYMGVIQNNRGDGMYLISNDFYTLGRIGSNLRCTSDMLVDLFEMRLELEVSACHYAALRRTDEDIENMQKCITKTRDLLNEMKDGDEGENLIEVSHAFHFELVKASHNNIFVEIYSSLFEFLDISKQVTITNTHSSYNGLIAHQAILDKIIARDSEGAKQTMKDHLQDAKRRVILLRKQLEENQQKFQ